MVIKERAPAHQCGSGTERHDAGHVLGAGPQALFLVGTVQDRPDRRAGAHVQRAHTLGGLDLVTGQCQQIDTELVDIECKLASGLRGIGVQQDASFARDTSDFANGL